MSPGPLARALSAQHSATTVNYGGIGALPLYKAYSQSMESSLDNSPTKVFLLHSVSYKSFNNSEAQTGIGSIPAQLAAHKL